MINSNHVTLKNNHRFFITTFLVLIHLRRQMDFFWLFARQRVSVAISDANRSGYTA